MWDYDEEGSHVLIEAMIGGQKRKIITHAARNGFLYSFEGTNGQTMLAKPYVPNINWTAGIDQKTGKPVDYDPNRDIQVYSGKANYTLEVPTKRMCPALTGGNNYFPPSYSRRTGLLYIPAYTMCNDMTLDQESIKKGIYFSRAMKFTERNESDMVMADRSPAQSRSGRTPSIRTAAAH